MLNINNHDWCKIYLSREVFVQCSVYHNRVRQLCINRHGSPVNISLGTRIFLHKATTKITKVPTKAHLINAFHLNLYQA